MAKQSTDRLTLELPGMPAPRGRPRVQRPTTGKERQRAYRGRVKRLHDELAAKFTELTDVQLARYSAMEDLPEEDRRACWIEFGRRNGWRRG